MDTRIEEDATKFFSDKKALERDPETQDRRNALLDRVRERLRQKVREQLERQLKKEAKKQQKSRRSSPEPGAAGRLSASPAYPTQIGQRAQELVSQLEL